ncbi:MULTISPECIES: ABC transporter ATP-binding protein [unclassified Minwuia]|jgi:microcin C transport system ATP-binding protein|uniref:ABC transporter ATP-binding protein n=1 Tax=unclassified Minwuia TaxID=2618799 RepID=UPI00247A2B55|nr:MULTISPECIES: ABC transporter ATP-binding protein [unclassified Minwuia]
MATQDRSDTAGPLLTVESLAVRFHAEGGDVDAVRGVSFTLDRGETLAVVGESGSGKSVTALSVMQLLPYPRASHPTGSIRLGSDELVGAPDVFMRSMRGRRISMIFQEPLSALNPLHNVEKQVAEVLIQHQGMTKTAARARVLELLDLVGIPDPESRLDDYPHQLSGGQRQRVMIAMALANEPDLLIADEPTTALDVTIQAQILELLKDLQLRLGMAILFITHDLGIVRRMADRVAVMTRGEIVEAGPTAQVMDDPQHDYTKMLLAAEPKGRPERSGEVPPPLLRTENLKVWFPIRRGVFRRTVGHVKAVDGIDIDLAEGRTVGVVGESGSGKTTLGQAILRLIRSDGAISFDGERIDQRGYKAMRPLRRQMQVVFQDPYGSLSPRLSVGDIIEEGLLVHGLVGKEASRRDVIAAALEEVGLEGAMQDRYPHEFSGGQRQRIAIARAIALKPRFIVLDEPTSALDMSVQAQIVDLLRDLQDRYNLAYLFISHDLKVVRALSDEVVVMKDGKVVERGPAQRIFDSPEQDYTKALLAAAFEHRMIGDG